MNDTKIIVAVDKPTLFQASSLIEKLSPELCKVKIGLETFIATGPSFINDVADEGFEIFLDLKLADIPNTVFSAVDVIQKLPVWGTTVYGFGGFGSLQSATNSINWAPDYGTSLKLFCVTVLTSFTMGSLIEMGVEPPHINHIVQRFANAAHDNNFTGVVCSAHEARLVKTEFPTLKTICPGIRPVGTDRNDQARFITPENAIKMGADYLVIGRPITEAKDPVRALENITETIDKVEEGLI